MNDQNGHPEGLVFPVGESNTHCTHLTIPAEVQLPYDPAAWVQTLVMVQQGILRLTCESGRQADFDTGAIVHLANLPLASIAAAGDEPALLLCLSTRPRPAATAEDADDRPPPAKSLPT